MIRSLVLVAVLCFAAGAKADNIVSVAMLPVSFGSGTIVNGHFVPGGPTVGVTFDWDTTTQVLSDFVVTTTALQSVISSTPIGMQFDNSGGIRFLGFSNAQGTDLFQLDYGIHGGIFGDLGSSPGTYVTDLFFFCSECVSPQNFSLGTAIVSPVSTPEPGALLSLLAGVGLIVGYFIMVRLIRWQSPKPETT
jgi:hypothetical protein